MGWKNWENRNLDSFVDGIFPIEEKAKVALIGVREEDRVRRSSSRDWVRPSVYLPIRSMIEDTRRRGRDWFGGTLEPIEMPVDGLIRDGGQELQGVRLDLITELGVVKKRRDGIRIASHLFAAIAEPSSGVATLSDEHSGGDWVPLDEIHAVETLPQKYKDALTSRAGTLIIQGLALIVQNEPLPQIHALAPYTPSYGQVPELELLAA